MDCSPDYTFGAVPRKPITDLIDIARRKARIASLTNCIAAYEALPPGSAKASLDQRYASAREELELLQPTPSPPPIRSDPGGSPVPMQADALDQLADFFEKNKTAVIIASGAIGILLIRKLMR